MIGARRGGEREQTTWSICVYKPCRPGVTWPCFDRNLARQHERANLLFYVVTDDDGCWSRRDPPRVRQATRFSLELADGVIALTVTFAGLVSLDGSFSSVSLIDHLRILGSSRRACRSAWADTSRARSRSRASRTRGESSGMREMTVVGVFSSLGEKGGGGYPLDRSHCDSKERRLLALS